MCRAQLVSGSTKKSRKKKDRRPRELSEDEAFDIALNDHPQYRRLIERDALPEEMVDEHGNVMSPRLHLLMHQIVERQLASDRPRGVVEIEKQLLALGVSRHDVRHIIGQAASEELWNMTHEKRLFDEGRYMRKLRQLVAENE
ncbi:MAG TPA: DUF1841 family protein [Pirellulales bacterium]|jgi:hypothetical protein|nr:DUF1841 family protein [Pirellulales bacterium]